jgi:hypothetical protein
MWVSFTCIGDQFRHSLYQLPSYNLIVEHVLGKTRAASMVDKVRQKVTDTVCMVVTLIITCKLTTDIIAL